MDFREVIKVAQEAVEVQYISINGIEYTDREIFIPPTRRTPPTLKLNTLSAISTAVNICHLFSQDHIAPMVSTYQ